MATIRRRGTKWQAQIQLLGHPAMSRTLTTKRDAELWARQVEAFIERGDLPGSRAALKTVTLLQMLDRYEATITPLKKGEASERYRLRVPSKPSNRSALTRPAHFKCRERLS